jgi:AcrR family transcriptional regulator
MTDDTINKPRDTRITRVRRASQQRRAQQKEELRQAILQAAGDLFLQQGYETFSLRQVAEYLGYSPTTIYLYFESKDALLFAVADDAYRLFCETEMQAFMSTAEPLERLIAIGRAYVDFGLTHPTAYKLIFAQRTDFLMGHFEGATQPRIDSFKASEQAVYLAIEAGAIRQGNPAIIFNALWSAMHVLVMFALTMPEFSSDLTQKVRDELLTTLLNGLLPR